MSTIANIAMWAAVMVIGGIGSMARYMIDRTVARRTAGSFPFGTLTVNITGAVILGFLAALPMSHHAFLLTGTAFVGAYTTFSTWMLETQRLSEERQFGPAITNIAVSVVLGIAAAFTGQWIASLL